MGDFVDVTIHIDEELDFNVVKSLLVGSNIKDLKECLAADDPTGGTKATDIRLSLTSPKVAGNKPLLEDDFLIRPYCKELFLYSPDDSDCGQLEVETVNAAVEPVSNLPAPAEVPAENVPTDIALFADFRVMQGTLFKKPGPDPTVSKVIKLERKVGSVVKTTGKTWCGKAGGEWVEVNPEVEKPGWLLIEGPGFNIPGPLLQKVEDGDDEQPLVLALYSAVSKKSYGEICAKPGDKITLAQSWINLRTEANRKKEKIWCVNATPAQADGDKFIKALTPGNPDQTFAKMDFKDGDTVVFVIVNEDFSFSDL